MPGKRKSVRAGIVAAPAARTMECGIRPDSTETSTSSGVESDVVLTRSGYIVVAG